MDKTPILALLGSTKQDSINKQILLYITSQLEECQIETFNLTALPYFNPSLDTEQYLPESVRRFRTVVEHAKGVIICSPEYVFSMPGVLKNALEWLVSTMIFDQKPTAVITAATSGTMAHESLILVLKTIGAYIENSASLLISNPKTKFDTDGLLTDAKTAAEIADLLRDFRLSLKNKE